MCRAFFAACVKKESVMAGLVPAIHVFLAESPVLLTQDPSS
jgi:hypothetical protein